jgi:hypothetical protein
MNTLIPVNGFNTPALVYVAGRSRADALLGILRLQHPQPSHAPQCRTVKLRTNGDLPLKWMSLLHLGSAFLNGITL